MADMLNTTQRKRSHSWTTQEVAILKEQCKKSSHVINASFSSTVTLNTKNVVWKSIAAEVNSVRGCSRRVDEVKKKWYNIRANPPGTRRHFDINDWSKLGPDVILIA